MHYSSIATLALAAAPAAVSAAGTLGFALGAKKVDGSCKFTADYEADMDAIAAASGSKFVRGYAADECNYAQQILPAARKKGFKVVLGVWPDVEEAFVREKRALERYATQYVDQVYAVTVGSETLYRGDFTGEELSEKIKEVKEILPNTKVGTADSWNKYADGTADAVVRGGVDILFVNAFAYWQGAPIENATATYFDDIMQAFNRIQSVAGSVDSIELWNGETGWPSDGGSDYTNPETGTTAEAGTANTKEYFSSAVCGMLAWNVNVFYFEAFDEPWKPTSVGDNGEALDETHWGVADANRKFKFSPRC